MRNTYLAVGIVVVILVIIAFTVVRSRLPQFRVGKTSPTPTPAMEVTEVTKSAISASKHTPASTAVVDSVTLEKPGFVAINDDQNGQPGQILGVSQLLQAGTYENVTITLSRKTVSGENLFAMAHIDNGDGTFGELNDEPAKEDDTVVMAQFQVSSEVSGFQIPATGLGEDDK